jgi:hypothetical protein
MSDLRWGDVLIAALDACCVVGVDETVQSDCLAQVVSELTANSGGMDGVRRKVAMRSLKTQMSALRKGEGE